VLWESLKPKYIATLIGDQQLQTFWFLSRQGLEGQLTFILKFQKSE